MIGLWICYVLDCNFLCDLLWVVRIFLRVVDVGDGCSNQLL
jgi:hypothetical protein